MVAWLSCFAKIFCASHKNVSSVFRFADCTLEKRLDSGKLDLGLVSAGTNGFVLKGRFFGDTTVIICVVCFIQFVVDSM